jgi:hypothetical protein
MVLALCGLAPPDILAADREQGDGMMGSEQPRIPEPMVFDLVRPLGSTRGELEINALAAVQADGTIAWAPEIEYTIADGLALELELPAENSSVHATKAAVQGTFTHGRTEQFIQGWQAIGEKQRADGSRSADGLYIAGYRWNDRWSALGMAGVRLNALGRGTTRSVLTNASIFFSPGDRATLGLEFNGSWGGVGRSRSWIPQVHVRLSDHWSVQSGVALNRRKDAAQTWALTGRLIYAF